MQHASGAIIEACPIFPNGCFKIQPNIHPAAHDPLIQTFSFPGDSNPLPYFCWRDVLAKNAQSASENLKVTQMKRWCL